MLAAAVGRGCSRLSYHLQRMSSRGLVSGGRPRGPPPPRVLPHGRAALWRRRPARRARAADVLHGLDRPRCRRCAALSHPRACCHDPPARRVPAPCPLPQSYIPPARGRTACPGPADDVTMTFGGNATMLLRIGGFTLLTDPNFLHRGQRARLGYGLRAKRLTEPALQPTQLPQLDGILLSHMHGDHWDRIATRSLPKDTPVVTTAEAAQAPGRPRVHRDRGPAAVADATSSPGAPRPCGSPPSRRARPGAAGAGAAAGHGQRPRAGPRRGRGRRLAGLHQRRHALPPVPGRGAGAVRAARRAHPAPRRHEGARASRSRWTPARAPTSSSC